MGENKSDRQGAPFYFLVTKRSDNKYRDVTFSDTCYLALVNLRPYDASSSFTLVGDVDVNK